MKDIVGFEWDAGNETKSAVKHDVAVEEAEQAFSNQPLLLLDDPAHSQQELRYHAFGKTNADRLLRYLYDSPGSHSCNFGENDGPQGKEIL